MKIKIATTLFFTLFLGIQTSNATGKLTFEESTSIPVVYNEHNLQFPWGSGTPSSSFPTLADIDGDDDLDFFIGTGDATIIMYKNIGTKEVPKFTLDTKQFSEIDKPDYILFPTFADTDTDGDLDLYFGDYGKTLNYYKNRGTKLRHELAGMLGAENAVDVRNIASPSFGDLDDDGDLDLLVGNYAGKIFYYENVGTLAEPLFILTSNVYMNIDMDEIAMPKLHDLDNDNDLDLIIGDKSGRISYFKNTGTPRKAFFSNTPHWVINTNHTYSYPALGDIDNDGDFDMFIGSKEGYTYFYENKGTAYESNFVKITDEYFSIKMGEYSAIDFADLNDDGDVDIYGLNRAGEFYQLENVNTAATPKFVLKKNELFSPDQHASSIRFFDIDNDKDFDLIVGYFDATEKVNGGHLALFRNIGSVRSPNFLKVEDFFSGIDVGEASSPEFFDYNGDGKLDLFVGNEEGNIFYYKNEGSIEAPKFTLETNKFEEITVNANATPRFADMDNDGDSDLVVGNKHGHITYFERVQGSLISNFINQGSIKNFLGSHISVAIHNIDMDKFNDIFATSASGNIYHFKQNSKNIYPPEPVSNVKVDINEHNITTITWKDSLNSEGDLSHYMVYQKTGKSGFGGGSNIFLNRVVTVPQVKEGQPHTVRIIALDGDGLQSKEVFVELEWNDGEIDYNIIYPEPEILNIQSTNEIKPEYCGDFTDTAKSSMTITDCEAIEFVKNQSIFTGTLEGALEPERPIKRSEVAKVIALAYPLTEELIDSNTEGEEVFNDINTSDWHFDFVRRAKASGRIKGYPDGSFKPEQTINKVELLKLILTSANVDTSKVDIGKSKYEDIAASEENEWFLPFTNFVFENALMDTKGGKFNPSEPMTRLDVIRMIYKIKLLKQG